MSEQQTKTEPIVSTSLRNLYKMGYWKTVSGLRFNKENNYPFVTLLNSKGKAQNIYFSKNSSKIVEDTFNAGDNIVSVLAEAEVIETRNERGELRHKISISNKSEYASNASILEIFGESDEKATFSFEDFNKNYYSSDLVEKEQTKGAEATA